MLSIRRSTQPIGPRLGPGGAETRRTSAGDKVSALTAEINIATLIVTANCRNSVPETPGMKATGTNTESSTRRDGNDRPGDLCHRLFRRLGGRQVGFLLQDAFDVLDDDDRVVDQDADRQHHREQRNRVGAVAHHQQHREAADHADRDRDRGDQGRAQGAEKQEDHDHDEREGNDQSDRDVADGVLNEGGGVVADEIFQTRRKLLAQAVEIGPHQVGGLLSRWRRERD